MGRPRLPVEPRLLARSELRDGPLADQCRVWLGGCDSLGYGTLSVDNRSEAVHRAAYVLWVGPIASGLGLDHLCRNPSCINPKHLEPVTTSENIRRGHAARGTLGGRQGERKKAAQRRYRERRRQALGPPKPPHNSLKTHCPRGHLYDETNTYVSPSRPTARYCRACKRMRDLKGRKRPDILAAVDKAAERGL